MKLFQCFVSAALRVASASCRHQLQAISKQARSKQVGVFINGFR